MPYVIAELEGRKRDLYQIKRAPNGGFIGRIPDHTRYHDGATFQIASDQILVHLPDEVPVGKAWGVHVEPILDRWLVRGYGSIYVHARVSEQMRQRIQRALLTARDRVERMIPEATRHDVRTEVRHPKGKHVGTYRYRPKGEDVLTLHTPETMGTRELVNTCAHEMAHGAWFRHMLPEQRARWITLYGRYVRVDRVDVGTVRHMVKGIRQAGSVRDYVHDAEPEDQMRVNVYMGWLAKVHKLNKLLVQDLVSAGEELPVPDVHLHRSETDTPITLYSKTSADEMFCEAVGSHAVGDLGDKRMIRMLDGRR